MSIKKFYATADTTITNAYKENLTQRGTDANMGLSDSLEIFFIYGQTPDPDASLADKLEESRILIKFDTDAIKSYYNDVFPTDVKFVLNLTNAVHPFTLARNYDVKVYHLANSFAEGNGLDMESYKDEDVANWTNREVSTAWTEAGGLEAGVTEIATQRFDTGEENLEVNITDYIEDIFDGTIPSDNGLIIVMDEALTDGSQQKNFYTKKFFSRSSEFFFKRPVIEARSANAIGDDRGKFYKASPALSSSDNENKVYFYNTVGGTRKSLELGGGSLYVRLYSDSTYSTILSPDLFVVATETESGSGIYAATITLPNDYSPTTVYDRWFISTDAGATETTILKEGSISVLTRDFQTDSGELDYVVDITNMKASYSREETAKFRIYTRVKDWCPTIYTVASKELENNIVEKIYYKIIRLVDEETVIDYGMGTTLLNNDHTLASYDALGSYFDFDMSLLESGYMYGIKLMFSVNGEMLEQPETFKFRVD
jgi:hypothetical protein